MYKEKIGGCTRPRKLAMSSVVSFPEYSVRRNLFRCIPNFRQFSVHNYCQYLHFLSFFCFVTETDVVAWSLSSEHSKVSAVVCTCTMYALGSYRQYYAPCQ